MTAHSMPAEKRMRLRYAGTCRVCGVELEAKADAIYERTVRTVRCLDCSPGATEPTGSVDVGTPGASARREFERRRDKREDRIRSKHPKLGGLILALSDDPQSTKAWDTGAVGEEQVGTRLNELASDSLRVLHDRRIPGEPGQHRPRRDRSDRRLCDRPEEVRGRPSLQVQGGLLRPRVEKLLVGSRDCTTLVDGVLKQVDVVRGIVGDGVPVHGVLCFVDADWPLIGGSFTTRGVEVLWPRKLYPRLQAEGSLAADVVADLHRRLSSALSAARDLIARVWVCCMIWRRSERAAQPLANL